MHAKNKLRILLIAASFFTVQAFAQPIVKLWDKTIGGNFADFNIANMLITPSKKIMVACISNSDAGFDKTASRKDTIYCTGTSCVGTWVFTLDKNGHKLWDQTYGGIGVGILHTKVFGLVQQNANSYMLGCSIWPTDSTGDLTDPYTFPGTVNGSGIWILDIDSLGNKIWNKRYFAQNMYFYFNDMILNDDNIYMSCSIGSIGAQPQYGNFFPPSCYLGMNDPRAVIFKINAQTKAFDWSFYFRSEVSNSLLKSKSNSLLMAGVSDSVIVCNKTIGSHGLGDYGLVSTDTLGNIQWQKNYGGSLLEKIVDVIATNDGGYLLYGRTSSPQGFDISQTGYNDTSLWVVKIDSLGTKLWDKRFGSCTKTGVINNNFGSGKESANHLAINTSDGGFLLATSITGAPCGDVTEVARGPLDYWLLKIDQNGVKQWDKRYGCLGNNYAESLAEMDTGIYLIGGTVATSTFVDNSGIGGDKTEDTRGSGDLWFVCFADTTVANLTSVNEIYQANSSLSIWPNPANDVLNYTLTGNEKIKNIVLSNMLGEKVLEINSPSTNAIPTNQLKSGVYLFKCETTKGKRFIKKVMVTK